jgi:hypothetical protein
MKTVLKTIVVLGFTLSIAACSKKEENVNTQTQQEVLTTLTLRFTDLADTNLKYAYSFRTNDGAAFGRLQKLDTVKLLANKNYRMAVDVLDESKQTIVNQTEEINELSNEHQFFYFTSPNGLLNFNTSTFNKDNLGKQLGTEVAQIASKSSTGNGSLRVILRHLPNKDGVGVAANDTLNAGGETDIAVTYPLIIQ